MWYIGKHQTSNVFDRYYGSGKILKRVIKKYGVEYFYKQILFVYDNEADMNEQEQHLGSQDVVQNDRSYNICLGGQGGFSYINNNGLNPDNFPVVGTPERIAMQQKSQTILSSVEHKNNRDYNLSKAVEARRIKYPEGTMKGKKHSPETKAKMSLAGKTRGNSQHGTMWITDGIRNKKIKKLDSLPKGFYKGRVM